MRRMVNAMVGKDGFVDVINEHKDRVPVVGGIRVDVDEGKSTGDKYFFAFVEGSNKAHSVMPGKLGNIRKKSHGIDTLISDAPVRPDREARLYVVLDKSTRTGGQIRGSMYIEKDPGYLESYPSYAREYMQRIFGPFPMVTEDSEKWEKQVDAVGSWYGIGFPDMPRPLLEPGYNSNYLGEATRSENIWFPFYTRNVVRAGTLENTESRFIHAGSFSAGCITVTAHDSWDYICQYLLTRRKSPTLVGAMHIQYK